MPHCEASGSGQVGACTRLAGSTGTHQLSGLTVFSRPDGDRTVVGVCGELDLSEDHQLRHALHPAPSGSDGGIRLDLGGIEFCGCSAVNLLLNIREHALSQSVPALELDEVVVPRTAAPPDGDEADLRLEVEQLRRAMHSRATIDLARGILMAAFAISADGAWKVLVSTSQHTNTKLRSLAEQVVESAAGTPLPDSVRERLSAAVARTAAEVSPGDGGRTPHAAAPVGGR
ncbi:ANTAR domain-containing protein [Streptomyces sp. NPDC048416]|uniref:ANTAR domain-containing protein n=1 Tax=Streptomyces sp. NPDC048416 TaxID=3365546 RepID=UPI003715C055